jgi:ASC-1-like (ASCH) protein
MDIDNLHKYDKYKTKYLNLTGQIGQIGQIGGRKNLNNKTSNKYSGEMADTVSMNLTKTYVENLSEPWFTLISLGLKTIEGRKNKGVFKEMKVGELIKWENNNFNPRTITTRITKKTKYPTFEEYLEEEGLDKCLPGIKNIEDGLSVYFKYYTKEDEEKYGVIAIHLELI